MAKFNPFQFLQEVRSETSKVTWPTRKEVMITTGMVFILVIVAAIFAGGASCGMTITAGMPSRLAW